MSNLSLHGFWGVASALALATAVFVAGCGKDTVKPPNEFAPPSNLAFENRSDTIKLTWNTSFDDNGRFSEFAGYNVYRDTESMAGLGGAELASRLIATVDPGIALYLDQANDASPLVLGTKYYYAVRTLRDNGDLSAPSNEVDSALFVQGTAKIYERTSGQVAGFETAIGEAVLLEPASADSIDFYLGTDAASDANTGALRLKSPNQISNTPPWNSRFAGLKLLATNAYFLSEGTAFEEFLDLGTTDAQVEGKIIAIRLPLDIDGNTHFAKVEIVTFNNDAGQRSIEFTYRYQPIPGYARF